MFSLNKLVENLDLEWGAGFKYLRTSTTDTKKIKNRNSVPLGNKQIIGS